MPPKLQAIDNKVLERLKLGPVSIPDIRDTLGVTDAQARASLDRLSRCMPELYEESVGRSVVYKLTGHEGRDGGTSSSRRPGRGSSRVDRA